MTKRKNAKKLSYHNVPPPCNVGGKAANGVKKTKNQLPKKQDPPAHDPCESYFFPHGIRRVLSMPAVPVANEQHKKPNDSQPFEANEPPNEGAGAGDAERTKACYQHYKGRCGRSDCMLLHHLRLPKELKLCPCFAKTGECIRRRSCLYMHSEFPCRYYHLGIPHPKSKSEENCAFAHGGAIVDEELANVMISDTLHSLTLGEQTSLERLQGLFEARRCELLAQRSNENDGKDLRTEGTGIKVASNDSVLLNVRKSPNDIDITPTSGTSSIVETHKGSSVSMNSLDLEPEFLGFAESTIRSQVAEIDTPIAETCDAENNEQLIRSLHEDMMLTSSSDEDDGALVINDDNIC